ncbi:MAG: 30S ribosomal protein S8 [Holosporales bacterium]|jgi:small subunit ribosomal protein S8|nr:30S ribosomal protein S8 [Holosporales bacterium]
MSLVDSVSDLITRIRNGQMARKQAVDCPMFKQGEAIVKVLQNEGYVRGYTIVENEGICYKMLRVELKYYDGKPVISEIKRISTPGRRVYSSIKDLPLVRNGLGISIISTSRGMLSDVDARKLSVGGEVICSVF